jgi:hypothetical protein
LPTNSTEEVTFQFNDTETASLERTFRGIRLMPEDVLASGDNATEQWLVENGYRVQEGPRGNIHPGWWETAKCAAAIDASIGTNVVSAAKLLKIKKYLAALGGFKKAAELLLKGSTWEERLRIGGNALVGLAAEILGVLPDHEQLHLKVLGNGCGPAHDLLTIFWRKFLIIVV